MYAVKKSNYHGNSESMFVFSFIGISQTLPTTPYIKLIDIWMIFTMTFLFLEVLPHSTKDILRISKGSAGDKLSAIYSFIGSLSTPLPIFFG